MIRSDFHRDETHSSLSEDCFATTNILGVIKDPVFDEYIAYLKDIVEAVTNKKLIYHYLHMISYDAGGYMTRHNHEHNEDISFILYLNSCKDGATIIHEEKDYQVIPQRNRMLIFTADSEHSAQNYEGSKHYWKRRNCC